VPAFVPVQLILAELAVCFASLGINSVSLVLCDISNKPVNTSSPETILLTRAAIVVVPRTAKP
jgi:hypothetical protein